MGLELLQVYPHSVNIQKFKMFLEDLRRKFLFDDILLVMDNLNLHRSIEVRSRMDELGFLYAYTPAYSPWYNGIEEVWSIGKHMIKQQRLQAILTGQNVNLKGMITKFQFC